VAEADDGDDGPAGWDQSRCEGRRKVRHCVDADNDAVMSFAGRRKEELMKRALMGVSAAAAITLAPLFVPPAQAHADDPCVSITDPAAHQACINGFMPHDPTRRHLLGDCEGASPLDGQVGQVCG
jgi:hypothetical protein